MYTCNGFPIRLLISITLPWWNDVQPLQSTSIKPGSHLRSLNSSCVQCPQSILVLLGSNSSTQTSGFFSVWWRLTLWERWIFPGGSSERDALGSPRFSLSAHFGDKSCRQAKGELLEEEGDTPSIFPGESVEEPTLLRLPSNRSGEWLKDQIQFKTEAVLALVY